MNQGKSKVKVFLFAIILSWIVNAAAEPMSETLYLSKKLFINSELGLCSGGLVVNNNTGTIVNVFSSEKEVNDYRAINTQIKVIDFGSKILMPGLIDTHVHINEPGRETWEGFVTATKAAAAGGFTTIADMPLNSIPPTTTVENLNKKLESANGKLYVDVAFWGGLVPENIGTLRNLLELGVVGFKGFLISSGVPEFAHVTKDDIEKALQQLEHTGAVLSFHAESELKNPPSVDESHPEKYETYLNTRPPTMEIEAIKMITELAVKYKNTRLHIVHLSAADALPVINQCRNNGGNLTVETCHHYLSISAEDIPDGHTEFKCCPPIREKQNQKKLWQAIINHEIDQVVSDHSPATSDVKFVNGNFLKAWGGIASNQFGLSLFWTNSRQYDLGITDIYRLMTANPSKLLGIDDRKGHFKIGYDADFFVWDPNENFIVTPEICEFKNKITPYMNSTLYGKVYSTFVRGHEVFNTKRRFQNPLGQPILKKILN